MKCEDDLPRCESWEALVSPLQHRAVTMSSSEEVFCSCVSLQKMAMAASKLLALLLGIGLTAGIVFLCGIIENNFLKVPP